MQDGQLEAPYFMDLPPFPRSGGRRLDMPGLEKKDIGGQEDVVSGETVVCGQEDHRECFSRFGIEVIQMFGQS